MINHELAQDEERNWWADCSNMLGEELKQTVYAQYMGLKFHENDGKPYQIDLTGKRVVDIGGGPQSLLLKANGAIRRVVADPCDYPNWVATRYTETQIDYLKVPGEEIDDDILKEADEVWIYNVLQHVQSPETIIKKAKQAGKIRIFEWLEAGTNHAHPHELTKEELDKWLGVDGQVVTLNGIYGCYGKAYYAEV